MLILRILADATRSKVEGTSAQSPLVRQELRGLRASPASFGRTASHRSCSASETAPVNATRAKHATMHEDRRSLEEDPRY